MLVHSIEENELGLSLKSASGSQLETDSLKEILGWLCEGIDLSCFWDLDDAASIIFRRLTEQQRRELADRQSTRVYLDDCVFNLRYVRSRYLMVARGQKKTTYYGLGQYFGYDYRVGVKPSLEEQQKMGKELLSELSGLGIYPTRLTSPAAFTDHLYQNIKIPNWQDYPDEVNQLAWEITGRAWTEAIQLGHFAEAFDYDLHSSYPSQMAKLPDTRKGEWHNEKRHSARRGQFGLLRVVIDAPLKISPYFYPTKSGGYFCSDKFETVMTSKLYDVMDKYYPGAFVTEIKEQWWWEPDGNLILPFDMPVRMMFNNRKSNPLLNRVMKQAMVAGYGRLLETHDNGHGVELAETFNPVYAALIEDGIKAADADFIFGNTCGGEPAAEHIISIETDGLKTDKPIDKVLPVPKLGDWKHDSVGEALILSTGCIFYGKRRPSQIPLETALSMIDQNPNQSDWTSTIQRRATLSDTLTKNYAKVGEMIDMPSSFGLPIEHDRHFDKLPHNGAELLSGTYKSRAYKAKEIKW